MSPSSNVQSEILDFIGKGSLFRSAHMVSITNVSVCLLLVIRSLSLMLIALIKRLLCSNVFFLLSRSSSGHRSGCRESVSVSGQPAK